MWVSNISGRLNYGTFLECNPMQLNKYDWDVSMQVHQL